MGPLEGGFVVRRSARRIFNCVPTDQALEQTINREGKRKTLHEELGTSHSNKDRKDMTDMKEYLYSQCQDLFDLDDVPDHLMNITTGQIASRVVEDSMMGIPERC